MQFGTTALWEYILQYILLYAYQEYKYLCSKILDKLLELKQTNCQF